MTTGYGYWFILGISLIIIELLSFTSHAFWLAISAFLTGITVYFCPFFQGPLSQVTFFCVFEGLLLVLIHLFFSTPSQAAPRDATLNTKLAQYQGLTFRLIEPLEQGRGAIKAGDTRWPVMGSEDLPEGAWVKVIGAEGVVLKVEKASDNAQN